MAKETFYTFRMRGLHFSEELIDLNIGTKDFLAVEI